MGRTVLYAIAALVLGGLMVAIPMCIGLSAYVLTTEPGEVSATAFTHAVFTGFVVYLVVLWATQETFEDQIGLTFRIVAFLVSPCAIMYFHAEWSLVATMLGLVAIASLAAYQMLVSMLRRHAAQSES